jgi:hypothetical protein
MIRMQRDLEHVHRRLSAEAARAKREAQFRI